MEPLAQYREFAAECTVSLQKLRQKRTRNNVSHSKRLVSNDDLSRPVTADARRRLMRPPLAAQRSPEA
jgi:hypothetical protein